MAIAEIDIHQSLQIIDELKTRILEQKQMVGRMEIGLTWDLGIEGLSGQQAQEALDKAIEYKRDLIRNLELLLQQEYRHMRLLEEKLRRQPGPVPR